MSYTEYSYLCSEYMNGWKHSNQQLPGLYKRVTGRHR